MMKQLSLTAIALVLFCGCSKSEESTSTTEQTSQAQGVEDVAIAQVEKMVEKEGSGFLKDISKDACKFLNPSLVASTFDVAEDDLKQMEIMGCIYSWKDKKAHPDETLEVNMIMLTVHKTEDMAKTWFTNSTKSITQEEAKAQMAQITAKAKEHESVDTKLKKDTTGTLGGLMAESVGGEGYTYEAVTGVGDEASIGLHDGILKVRVGNLTFSLAAYKGASKPKPNLNIKDLSDIQKMAAEAMVAEREWIKKTFAERKQAVTKLAPLVVKALPKH